ncbi:uncharacterized protein B0I36DRAFT_353239 [Microdochium trichocladiopsis]|uniref:WSC domain-containing protein n=1 Tax=Microdochium trichocladiopsis TaxID=1682393 RepID=A0A9P9BLP0_9PEZI|nr:uncharacterized protein B0I36DRAFT_353239 [Microdochium trichocladiopsis]KAH7025074.1 hypothetical protein B0I36DRAFT_353239 [Microdochium trichocladiopsis]
MALRLLAKALALAPAMLASAQELQVPKKLPGNWTYQYCWTDVGRTIDTAYSTSKKMTIESCLAYCEQQELPFAGVEYYNQCFCGLQLAPGARQQSSNSSCNTPCAGNSRQPCGGADRLTLFHNPTLAGFQPNHDIEDWPYLGCYTEGTKNRRALQYQADIPPGDMTGRACTSACQAKGFHLAGTEYSNQCFCGDAIKNGGTAAANACVMKCSGNSTEICGGADRLSVYSFKGVKPPKVIAPMPSSSSSTSKKATSTSKRSTSSSTKRTSVTTTSTTSTKRSSTTSSGKSTGTTTSSLTGKTTSSSRFVTSTTTSATTTSSGMVTSTFGSSSTSTITSTSTTSTSSSSSPTSSTPPGFPAGWSYFGCWQDGPGPRILPQYQAPDNANLTRESCANLCDSMGYNISGTEYFRQCFCSNDIYNGGKESPDDSGCQTPCSGNTTEMCGGSGYLTIYSDGTPEVFQPPAVQLGGLNGTWQYQGCYVSVNTTDNTHNLPWKLELPDTNDPETCLSLCGEFGYMAAGLEYGLQCFCGDPQDVVDAAEQKVDESQCNIACSGNATVICSGGNRHTLYYWNGTSPLYAWHYPQGAGAGAYSFLVPGVVTPLMTMQSVTGKVTFLEKYGTGLPNSTGAYELDLTLVDDFAHAWREMHVETDIFCSAGIILPDKGARQLTIGGWSLESTFGVRLYWPDGSPGVNGTHDWQENVQELSLQQGRWYPSAMIMANGSVLVVGGETGSNAGPVPTLEILPFTGTKPLYMDWLYRTDPNNLYPFLAVLPSGGIFVQYWNEARILDERTFETTRILPNATGSVIDPRAGRNYPLEGTAVLLPQVAPYTEPLMVLICGGATTTSIALDNCVSIQPDAADPQWTLERMPSKRVMSCIAPLPDGTYLILNGAQQGVAGFGLATDPNLGAVLYDPSLPAGQRMSVMATTIVARLYHSEAITLLDGRVLVSGSDPQDGVHPEEMRVEVFTPPYLLALAGGNRTRPSFTVPAYSKDWTYGSRYTVQIGTSDGGNSTTAGPVSGVQKFSLLGSVSSTHGNSMGARTLFPAFTCAGSTCVITAPPSAHICPPGWYQLFYLVDGIPAVGTYVRIGGDPASLGNWPQYPDFTTPGV